MSVSTMTHECYYCNPASVWRCLSTPSALSSWDDLLGTTENSNTTPFKKDQVVALDPSSSRVSSEIHIVSLDEFRLMAYEIQIPKGKLRITHSIEMRNTTSKRSCCMTRKIDFIPRNVDPVPLTGKEIVNYSLSFIQCVSS